MVYHQLSVQEVLNNLNTTHEGLSASEVQRNQQVYGRNKIPQPKAKTLLHIFFSQFLSPLIYVLIGAAIISIATGDLKDALFIAAIIVINAILGTYQEWRAENSAAALRNMVRTIAKVKRGGKIDEVDSEDLVPGDIVILESGNKVPADLRLVDVQELSVEEALLTGESLAVMKVARELQGGNELAIGDRVNMLFAGTVVQRGRGKAVVVATAKNTEIGKIAESLKTTEQERPPLVNRMDAFSKKISVVVLVICIILGFIGYQKGIELKSIFLFMVAVGVSAIPEGLPVALTVALSIGTRRMVKRNVIVRKLPAVEGLGSCTLIASDKTGTLTMDKQCVKRILLANGKSLEVTGQGHNGEGNIKEKISVINEVSSELFTFIQAVVLSNESVLTKSEKGWQYAGDAVDVALTALAYKAGKDPAYFQQDVEIVKMIPYESEKGFSAVFFTHKGLLRVAMKGAIEVISGYVAPEQKPYFFNHAENMAAEGYRVLAIAGDIVDTSDLAALPPLQMLGLSGMIDPLRPEAKAAVSQCKEAGIQVLMVTGDHPATALAIAKELGIAQTYDEIITGVQLTEWQNIPDQEFADRVRHKTVFARVTPLQKQRIVEAMKTLGHFVAVTGDGANDAPALKSSHIGVAMGGGTDLAKEAAAIIVTDNNFASIAAGVEEGRFTYNNLRKIIYLLISTGAAELMTIALALLFNTPLPFLAVQLLWLNLVTNGIQDIALAFEKGDKAVMRNPPRKPDESIFDRLMNLQIFISGIVIAGVVFSLWYYLINYLKYEEAHARTIIMMLMVLLQNFHALNCRSETKSIFNIPISNNYFLFIGILLAQAIHIAASYIPGLSSTLQLDPIHLDEWLKLLPTGSDHTFSNGNLQNYQAEGATTKKADVH
jgi:magnesium-transporting ATPase (P-type)